MCESPHNSCPDGIQVQLGQNVLMNIPANHSKQSDCVTATFWADVVVMYSGDNTHMEVKEFGVSEPQSNTFVGESWKKKFQTKAVCSIAVLLLSQHGTKKHIL